MVQNGAVHNKDPLVTYRIIRLDQVDSTNTYARNHLATLADEAVVVAEMQTEGRGRGRRVWISKRPGNLYVSLVLKPAGPLLRGHPLANLSQLLAVVVCDELESYQVTAMIKWPNDILVEGRKMAGILAEAVTSGAELVGLVLGLGLNLNLQPDDLHQIDQPATSLNLLTGNPIRSDQFLKSLLDRFFAGYPQVLANGFGAIRADYVAHCAFLNQPVTINTPDGSLTGRAMDITEEGELELLLPQGQIRRLSLGEIMVSTPGKSAER
jgi:BirA family biotin operon repressor/biotin-[acetyl-CoA-carboxylase] ligase